MFQLTVVFGQIKTENKKGYGLATGGFKPNRQEIPTQPKTANTNNKSYTDNCYKNLEFTVKNYGYSKDGNHYSWGIKVKNNYTKAVSLRYKLIVGNDKTSVWAKSGTVTYNIKPGETYDNDMGTLKALIVPNNSDQYRIEISEVCFEGQDCIKNGYADCNGKQSQVNNSKGVKENVKVIETYSGPTFQFDRSKAYNVYRDVIKDLLVNNGFHLIKFDGDNSAKYIFQEFEVTYSPVFSPPYFIRNISFRQIKSREAYEKLYNMFGCKNSQGSGRKCTAYSESKYSYSWFDVSID